MLIRIAKGLICVLSCLLALNLYADDELKENCLKAWNDSTVIRVSRADYQQFGDKYCDCAAVATFNSREELAQVAETCMSQTVLNVMIDSLRQQASPESMTKLSVNNSCQETLKIIYPQMNKNQAMVIANYCHCVVPEFTKLSMPMLNDKQLKAITKQCAAFVTRL